MYGFIKKEKESGKNLYFQKNTFEIRTESVHHESTLVKDHSRNATYYTFYFYEQADFGNGN